VTSSPLVRSVSVAAAAVVAVVAALALAPFATADDLGVVRHAAREALVADAGEQVRRGADLYALNCAVCHGGSGLGYEEARAAFPEDHRTCTRCHRPGNPRVMSFDEMNERVHDLFDVGDPPALRGAGALVAFPNAAALSAYNRATMPRYEPGRLRDDEYLAITAFLLAVNGRWDAHVELTPDAAAGAGTGR
jgi:hypothetical protein